MWPWELLHQTVPMSLADACMMRMSELGEACWSKVTPRSLLNCLFFSELQRDSRRQLCRAVDKFLRADGPISKCT